LFDAARIMDPSDAEAYSNYAFCLTPDDPEEALRVLRHAETLERNPLPINRINQAVVLRLLGRRKQALECAERAFGEADLLADAAWLWQTPDDAGSCRIVHVDPTAYLVQLGVDIAPVGIDTTFDGALLTLFAGTPSPAFGPDLPLTYGLTRNGTFLIEDGEVVGAVGNLRFTQSFLGALAEGRVLEVRSSA
jgi:tetratricopeptide (TPR) repeat protein